MDESRSHSVNARGGEPGRRILHIIASPRGDSLSRELAEHYLEEREVRGPIVEIRKLELWREELPELEGATLAAVMSRGETGKDAGYARIREYIRLLEEFDEYVFSLPMWNFSIPYKLKHFVDLIIQPGLTFDFDPAQGFVGLLRDKEAVIFASRGSVYSAAPDKDAPAPWFPAELDFQVPYMHCWLDFIGVARRETFISGPTFTSPEGLEETRAHGKAEITARARLLHA